MTETNDSDWFSEETATFGDRLAGAREGAGLSQKELAARVGVRTLTVIAWENDAKEPRANRLQMLAGILGVSLSWLLTGKGEGPEGPPDFNELPEDLNLLLADLRELRTQMATSAERMARLEKRIRTAIKDMA
jgi:transcriptional regulator with XRE-family HTH domain